MAVRNRLEVTVLPQDFSKEQQEQARKNISAAAISATVSKIESSDGSVSAEAYTAADGSIHYNLKVSAEPVISDTVIHGTNGISAKNQGVNWTIGLSADYLTANALNNLSGNWQNTYNTVTNNSGKWNEVSSKLDTTAFSTVSGQFAIKTEVQKEFEQTSSWAVETFQPKGDYLSASEKYLSANALDDLSGNWNSVYDTVESYSGKWNDASATLFNNSSKWNSVYNTVDTNSANWGKGYNWIFDNSANIINASATLETNSGNWNSVYNTVETNSGNWENSYTALTSTSATWNNHSALSASKLDKAAFEEWSANADVTEYSGVSPISISEHKVSIDLSEYYKKTETSGKEELNDRFEPIEADLDILKENSAHNIVESKNDYIKVYSGTNKFELEFVSGDLATKTWVEQVLNDFGGFVPADPTGADNHPNVANPNNKKIYLVADATAPEPDKSREWIVTGEDPNTGWYCIGDTSLDLTPYVKISDISAASATWNNAYNWVYNNSANVVEASGAIKEVSSTFTAYSGKWNDASATLFNNSSNWNTVYDTVDSNSSKWENSYTALTSKSADWNEVSAKLDASESAKYMFLSALKGTEDGKLSGYGSSAFYYPEIPEYSGKDGIKIEDYWITISADYLSANALDELSGNWDSVYTSVNENSASWNETSAVVNDNSAKWNEASAFSANSGKFVTSALNDFTAGLAHVLTKDENDNVAWSGIDLSDLGKMYPITSLTPDIVSATISAVDGTSAYVLSAKEPDPVEYFNISANKMSAWSGTEDNTKYYFLSGANISGNNGISAEYNPQINQWDIGLENPSYNYAVARTDITTLTATTETISGFIDIDAAGITFENDVVTLDKGLYHVDIQVNIPVNDIDESYYEVTLTPSLSYAVLRQTIDASYAHNTTLDLSFDVNLLTDGNELTFTLAGLPVGARYKVENFQIHEVTTIDSLIDIDGGIYHAGVATQIDGQQNINVEFNPASGIDVDANNKLYVKLGKGLKFDEAGAAAGTLTLDNVTEEVVDTVQNLKTELDNKLTMNMNYSDAKKVGSPVSDIDGAGACMVASLFHVNLTHEINENTELTIYCSQACPQSDVLPYMFGVFEYNFNYYDNDESSPTYGQYRPQTTWLFDTGILNATIPANKYTMKVKNIRPVTSYSGQDAQGNIWVNEYKAEMRSDRLYYAAMFCRQKSSNFYLLCDEGYEANTNSNPKITWFNDNMKYCGPLSAEVPANIADWGQWGSTAWEAVKDTMTFDHVNWWGNNTSEPDNTYREKNTAYRYLLQVRNNNTNVGGN